MDRKKRKIIKELSLRKPESWFPREKCIPGKTHPTHILIQTYEFIHPQNQIEIVRDGYKDDYSYLILYEHCFSRHVCYFSLMKRFKKFAAWLWCIEQLEFIICSEIKQIIWELINPLKVVYRKRIHGEKISKQVSKYNKSPDLFMECLLSQGYILLNQDIYYDKKKVDSLLRCGVFKKKN